MDESVEENRKEEASACGCVLCVLCVSRLIFVLTFDVKRSFRVGVCVRDVHPPPFYAI